ncbi:helix-turn-helix domain-containing protein [Massilia sp. H6]|uniref:helix-turn-helix domain-containing protein n=1 Tax=Massilia sp. H6 TaxID=2970464 RepID=UPI002168C2B7|nr:helix-turn-helix domain-containing protein [Massilia sp. H6]UVW27644.1 helix-turn-helix domain-containing protein [Massilia sp. H6]
MNEHADQPATPGNDVGLPGKTLQSQREALGWSVEQVADQLKLAPRQVVALEAGDYAALPSPAVTRGFVRAYAKLLKIDAAPLVAKIAMNMPPEAQAGAVSAIPRREPRPAAFSQSRFPIGGKRSRVPAGLVAGAVAVIAAGAALWYFGLLPGGKQAADRNADGGMILDNPVIMTPEVATPAGPDSLMNPSVPLISVPAPGSETIAPATAPATTPVAPAGAAPTLATAPAAAPATPVAAAAPGANALVLNVREDSWIEVRPARGGKPLISRLVKGGSTETIEVAEPVNLVVGKPSAVSASLRGASIDLPQQPGKTIARVALK